MLFYLKNCSYLFSLKNVNPFFGFFILLLVILSDPCPQIFDDLQKICTVFSIFTQTSLWWFGFDWCAHIFNLLVSSNVLRAPASVHHSCSPSVRGDPDLRAEAAGAECGAAETSLHYFSRVSSPLWCCLRFSGNMSLQRNLCTHANCS